MTPMGTMARRYTLPVIGTFLRESKTVVKRAKPWVIRVAKPKCHVVRTMAAKDVSFQMVAVDIWSKECVRYLKSRV
jgi:hypothetical protein